MPFLGPLTATSVTDRFPCREQQVEQLQCLLGHDAPRPSSIVVHGGEATGKSSIVLNILSSGNLPHAIIKCAECITGRHLLERTIAECRDAAPATDSEPLAETAHTRCENLSSISAQLQQVLRDREPFVLVLDGIDYQREAPHTLLPALARIADLIPNLTIVFIISLPNPRLFHHQGIPHIDFPAYDRAEALHIISQDPSPIYPVVASTSTDSKPTQYSDEDDQWLWTRFCAAVWDSLAYAAARDIVSFRSLAQRLWGPFVFSVIDGTYGARDFSRLMIAKRALFQNDESLVDGVTWCDEHEQDSSDSTKRDDVSPLSKYILCAAYLASYNPPRLDPLYFMEWTERKRKRKGGKGGGGHRGRQAKYGKIPRRALPPSAFPLARLLAILSAIHPAPLPAIVATDVLTSAASLTSCRLLLRAGASGLGGDPLGEGAKWKVNVGWEYVVKLGRSVGIELQEWSAE